MGGKAGSLPGSDAGCKDCMALCEEVRCSSGNALYADRTKPCEMEQGQRPPAPEAGAGTSGCLPNHQGINRKNSSLHQMTSREIWKSQVRLKRYGSAAFQRTEKVIRNLETKRQRALPLTHTLQKTCRSPTIRICPRAAGSLSADWRGLRPGPG